MIFDFLIIKKAHRVIEEYHRNENKVNYEQGQYLSIRT